MIGPAGAVVPPVRLYPATAEVAAQFEAAADSICHSEAAETMQQYDG